MLINYEPRFDFVYLQYCTANKNIQICTLIMSSAIYNKVEQTNS